MKKTLLLSAFVLSITSVMAQVVWNKKLPLSSVSSKSHLDARMENGRLLLTAGSRIIEIDPFGTVTGYAAGWNSLFSNYIQKKHLTPNGEPFFTLCTRGINANSPQAYSIVLYKPSQGFSAALEMADSLGISTKGGPAVVELNDQSFWVLGRKFVRQVSVSDQAVVSLDWEMPLPLSAQNVCNAAVLWGNQVFAVTNQGSLLAMDLSGQLLWMHELPGGYIFRGLTALNDGLLACGTTSTGAACLVKFDSNGQIVWAATPGDALYNAVAVHPDGTLAVTGSDGTHIVLIKTDANGALLWRQIYQTGQGGRVTLAPDGGYFISAIGAQANVYALKTNVLGECVAPEEKYVEISARSIRNSGLSLTQPPSSSLFFNGSSSALSLPADSTTTTVFAHSPWFSGKDPAGNLSFSGSKYGEANNSDFRLGIGTGAMEDFNRVWRISRTDIAQLRRDFELDGQLGHAIPYDLLTWPAKGNPNFLQNLDFSLVSTYPDSLPAPFVDRNGDGRYNIYDGDYPKLKGDQMLWWVLTDQAEHKLTLGKPLGVDVMHTVYAYDCPQNQQVAASVFVDYQVINRSGQSYSDAYMAFFTDLDIGCSDDDFVGSIPALNSYYGYNSDATDGNPGASCAGGVNTYDAQIPIQTITLLNHSLDHSMSYAQMGPSGPVYASELYQFQQSIWTNGAHLTRGGNGNNPGSTDFTNFIFPDNPADPQGWSMCSAGIPLGDRLMVNAHGPFSFAAGDTFVLDLAFTFHPNIPHPCPNVEQWIKPGIQEIQQWYQNGNLEAHADLGVVQTLPPGQSLVLQAAQPDPGTSYLWSTGETTSSITVNQPGEYTVSITPTTECAYSETVLVKAASGTNTPTLASWKLQPNPASDVVQIVLEQSDGPMTVLIHNALGYLVLAKRISTFAEDLSLSDLPPGVYWVELWEENIFLGCKKLIIMR